MNGTPYRWIALIVGVALFAAAGGYYLARYGARPSAAAAGRAAADGERRVLYWYDPMHPEQHFDQPSKSPYMDMPLQPRYADAGTAAAGGERAAAVRIDPGVAQNLAVRYTTVERGPWSQSLDAVGSIVFDQRRVAVIQARAGGFVTSVHARAPGEVLPRGAAIVDLLVPDWAGAQAEFVALLNSSDRALIDAARTRLTLLGMSPELIERVAARRTIETTVTIRTPIAGVLESLDVRAGMTVSAGATLAKIDGIETVWLEAAVPEAQGALATVGGSVEARLGAWPAETFRGRVIALLPEANAETRTLRLRIEIGNRDGRLKPGMFAQVHLEGDRREAALQVASEAIIRTGTRSVVLVARHDGSVVPTEVQLGPEAQGRTVIVAGLEAGQRVIASGQFLIDSEASLKGVLARMHVQAEAPLAARGKVEEVTSGDITLAHEAIPALAWPAMTMTFRLERPGLGANLRPGDKVNFRLRQAGDEYVVEELDKLGEAR
jgi:Cu(I)/Ag(I) efflux system membrane fusion protein